MNKSFAVLVMASSFAATCCTAIAAESADALNVSPLVIETIVPRMTSDNAIWRVKVTAGYIAKPGVSKKIDVMSFDIPSGECRSGTPKNVPMQGFDAKVTPKLCAGEVDGQSVILGWLVADKVDSEPMSSIDLASLNYGERMYFRFNGSELTAEASIYHVEAKKLSLSAAQAAASQADDFHKLFATAFIKRQLDIEQ